VCAFDRKQPPSSAIKEGLLAAIKRSKAASLLAAHPGRSKSAAGATAPGTRLPFSRWERASTFEREAADRSPPLLFNRVGNFPYGYAAGRMSAVTTRLLNAPLTGKNSSAFALPDNDIRGADKVDSPGYVRKVRSGQRAAAVNQELTRRLIGAI
jgi:hypothetical protein